MNNNTRNEFASYGLDILKRSVLLVLYEGTDIVYEVTISTRISRWTHPQSRADSEELNILQSRLVYANTNSLIHGILDHLRHNGHAYHYVGDGWGITEKEVSVIEGSL